MQCWGYFIQCPADSYTVVVIRVVPKRMADDRLVCMKWVDERKTTSDKGVNMRATVAPLGLEPSPLNIASWPF